MESLNLSSVTLEGFAQGGIRTSIGVPEVGAIFDAGTPIPTCVRYKNIFITHGHPDHCGAITTIVARRSLQDLPPVNLYVPNAMKDPLEVIFEKWWEINGGRGPKFPVTIMGAAPGFSVNLKKGIDLFAVKTYHRVTSVGWSVERTTQRLLPEFKNLTGPEIGNLKKKGTEITSPHVETLLTIPGDTTIDFLIKEKRAREAKVLVHEVTYWDDTLSNSEQCKKYGHTHFRDMIQHCDKFEGDFLVLCHRSMKYSRKFVEKQIKDHFPKEMIEKIRVFDGGDRT